MIKTLIASLTLILISVPMAAAAGPEIIVAHRGFGGAAQVKYWVPEQSLAAYGLAIEKAEQNIYVDLDLQHSSDGYMVDIHDRTLDRTTNCIGPVVNKKLADIKKCFLELPVDRNGNGNDDNTRYHPPSGNQSLDFLRSKRCKSHEPSNQRRASI